MKGPTGMSTSGANEQRGSQTRQIDIEPIAMRVPEACRYLGIGRSTLYVLIGDGEIEFIKLGSSTLVLTESLKRLVESKRNILRNAAEDASRICIPILFMPSRWPQFQRP
ncbi:helix-turn-helix domain-containing protein [Qipengyuania pacifica]|jgi:excisionase family DNA binding protein|uniref:helix-turn-helix domain-containing protein n=2 Tax=Erythrobacteraceae TaxID=335929 RepID=UPI002006FD97|nr:helix-turn-helix domain-containing protein [Qipengyuania pacifica]|tara:strand:+ start:583 stop:912 length:330 start_codon:yes stop_codon:yes gene_type:complete